MQSVWSLAKGQDSNKQPQQRSTGAPALTPQYNSDLFAKAGVV